MEFPDARQLGGPDLRDEVRASGRRRAGDGVIRARDAGEDSSILNA